MSCGKNEASSYQTGLPTLLLPEHQAARKLGQVHSDDGYDIWQEDTKQIN